ncbi:hypothetical protein [Mariniphaga sp.]|uniref:hypothetical protein n=1 Tax=Mariniphaga sp. TaxID=1954475 RepID=UPI00356AFE86
MKTITGIILVFALAVLTSCTGEPGPPGRDGTDGQNGQDGESFLGSVFEIEGDFTSQNDYTLYFQFPSNITVYDTDVVLVYILWEVVEDNSGDLLDVWRLLPQTVVLDEGVLQYNFDYTFADVQVFLEGTLDFNTLLPAETDNQVFRIVVFPADFIVQKSLDVSDYNMMMKSLGVKKDLVQKIDMNTQIEINK